MEYLASQDPEWVLVFDEPPPVGKSIHMLMEFGGCIKGDWNKEYGVIAWRALPKLTKEQKERMMTLTAAGYDLTVHSSKQESNQITMHNYQMLCRRTQKPESKAELMSHALEGIVSEAGGIADTIKKYKRYGQALDRDNIREEAGDLLYYVSMLMDSIGESLQQAAVDNVAKLQRRYPEGFSEAHAEARMDKGEVGYES